MLSAMETSSLAHTSSNINGGEGNLPCSRHTRGGSRAGREHRYRAYGIEIFINDRLNQIQFNNKSHSTFKLNLKSARHQKAGWARWRAARVISFPYSTEKISDNIDLCTRKKKTIWMSIFAISFIILGHVSSVGMFRCCYLYCTFQNKKKVLSCVLLEI